MDLPLTRRYSAFAGDAGGIPGLLVQRRLCLKKKLKEFANSVGHVKGDKGGLDGHL